MSSASRALLKDLQRQSAAIVAAALLLGGCAGDFGRAKPARDEALAWFGPTAARPFAEPPWRMQLTEHERRLRNLAFPLIDPPYHRNHWDSALNEFGLLGRS